MPTSKSRGPAKLKRKTNRAYYQAANGRPRYYYTKGCETGRLASKRRALKDLKSMKGGSMKTLIRRDC